jgi:competence protein ComEC
MFPSEKAASNNESGICILFQAGECDILITGDRNAAGERELIKHTVLPDIDVLIVGHHGSKTSTCRELLIKAKPEIAIISVGADNSYGHPTKEVLDRLTNFGCKIFRTDLDGTVIYRG